LLRLNTCVFPSCPPLYQQRRRIRPPFVAPTPSLVPLRAARARGSPHPTPAMYSTCAVEHSPPVTQLQRIQGAVRHAGAGDDCRMQVLGSSPRSRYDMQPHASDVRAHQAASHCCDRVASKGCAERVPVHLQLPPRLSSCSDRHSIASTHASGSHWTLSMGRARRGTPQIMAVVAALSLLACAARADQACRAELARCSQAPLCAGALSCLVGCGLPQGSQAYRSCLAGCTTRATPRMKAYLECSKRWGGGGGGGAP